MNLQPIFKALYPEGKFMGPVNGQCFHFLRNLVKYDPPGLNASLAAKISAMKTYGIPIAKVDSLKIGDIILTNESKVFGHGAIINYINGNNLQLTEANFKLDFRVHHTRQLAANSPHILGVFRGIRLYTLPPVQFPLQIPIMVLLNNSDPTVSNNQFLMDKWQTIFKHLPNLQSWFWESSGQRIEIIMNYKVVNLKGWETVFTGPSIGGSNVEIIKEQWFDQHVLPLGDGAQIVLFNMARNDWHGTVFDHPELIELGYCYEKVDMPFPVKIMTVSDQYDDYPPYYQKLSAFAKLMAHEIAHGLYGLAVNSTTPSNGRSYPLPPGTDICHNWFLGATGSPIAPERFFEDLDFATLSQKLNT